MSGTRLYTQDLLTSDTLWNSTSFLGKILTIVILGGEKGGVLNTSQGYHAPGAMIPLVMTCQIPAPDFVSGKRPHKVTTNSQIDFNLFYFKSVLKLKWDGIDPIGHFLSEGSKKSLNHTLIISLWDHTTPKQLLFSSSFSFFSHKELAIRTWSEADALAKQLFEQVHVSLMGKDGASDLVSFLIGTCGLEARQAFLKWTRSQCLTVGIAPVSLMKVHRRLQLEVGFQTSWPQELLNSSSSPQQKKIVDCGGIFGKNSSGAFEDRIQVWPHSGLNQNHGSAQAENLDAKYIVHKEGYAFVFLRRHLFVLWAQPGANTAL